MDVTSVDNTSLNSLASKHTKEFTLERNPMGVISVDNTSLKFPTLKNTREFTPERNLMGVISVDNTSLKCPTLKDIDKFTQGSNPFIVMSVEKLLVNHIEIHKVVYIGFKCGNRFTASSSRTRHEHTNTKDTSD